MCVFINQSINQSIKRPNAFEISKIHPDKKRFADNIFIWHETPITRVQRVVAVVTHHEVVANRYLANNPLATVAAILFVWKVHDLALINATAPVIIIEQAVFFGTCSFFKLL